MGGEISYVDSWAMHPPFSFRSCRKENGPCTVQKKRTLRRVGLRRRRPPAAGGGWLAVPCSSQGRKRPALGETSSPGKYRDTLSLPPRCRSRSREEQPAAATAQPLAALPLTDAAYPLRVKEKQLDATTTPTRPAPSATGRQYLPRRRVKRARRSGKIGAGTDTPTPVRTEGRCTGVRPSGLFFWTVHGPFSFPQDGKENGGCILAGQAPLAGASPPWPLFSGPHHSRGRAPKTGAPPLYFSSNTDTYTVPLTSNPSLAFT